MLGWGNCVVFVSTEGKMANSVWRKTGMVGKT